MTIPFLLGRVIFGGFFLFNGINHFRRLKNMAQYAGSKKVPMPQAAVIASGSLIAAGGASLMLGIRPKYGALAVTAFLGAVSPVMHDFWRVEDPAQREADLINFAKNMAMLGAALALIGVEEPWPASVPLAQPERAELVPAA